jgi:hypothetical protein
MMLGRTGAARTGRAGFPFGIGSSNTRFHDGRCVVSFRVSWILLVPRIRDPAVISQSSQSQLSNTMSRSVRPQE